MTENQYAIVMAAGKGTRMKSELPKVLYPVCGKPMIEYVLDALEKASIGKIIVVVGYRSDLVRETLKHRTLQQHLVFVEQTEQLGTGHAIMVCRNELQNHTGATLVVAGDCPMIQVESIRKLLDAYSHDAYTRDTYTHDTYSHKKEQKVLPSCILGTIIKENPTGLGRIIRNQNGEFIGIVEEKDADTEQKLIKEVNMSYYVFHTPDLLEALNHLRTDNAQKEYYITDVPAVMKSQGHYVIALPVLKPIESLGINTVEDAKIVETALQNQSYFER